MSRTTMILLTALSVLLAGVLYVLEPRRPAGWEDMTRIEAGAPAPALPEAIEIREKPL